MMYEFKALRTMIEVSDQEAKRWAGFLVGKSSFAVTTTSMKPDHVHIHLSDASVENLRGTGVL